MSRRIVKPGPGQRIAIRHGDLLLSVPPMNPSTPSAVRVKVFEYVIRRQIGLAQMCAQFADEVHEERESVFPGISDLISEAPHSTTRRPAA